MCLESKHAAYKMVMVNITTCVFLQGERFLIGRYDVRLFSNQSDLALPASGIGVVDSSLSKILLQASPGKRNGSLMRSHISPHSFTLNNDSCNDAATVIRNAMEP